MNTRELLDEVRAELVARRRRIHALARRMGVKLYKRNGRWRARKVDSAP